MKNPFNKLKSLSSEAKAGVALLGGAGIIFVSAFALSNTTTPSDPVTKPSISNSQTTSHNNNSESPVSEHKPSTVTPPSTPLVDVMEEEIIKPYSGELETLRHFYELSDPVEIRTKSIVKIPGETSTYIKSVGVDYIDPDGKTFDVVASLSGKVVDKLSDPTYGNVLIVEHKSNIRMIYASLGEMKVNKGEEVKQGDIIATSGTSLYISDYKSSLHFEIIKGEQYYNPEKLYSTSIKEL